MSSLHDLFGSITCNLNLTTRCSPNEAAALEFVKQLVYYTDNELQSLSAELESLPDSHSSQPRFHLLSEVTSFIRSEYEIWLLWDLLLSNPSLPIEPPQFCSPLDLSSCEITSNKNFQTLSVVKSWCEQILSTSKRYTPSSDSSSSFQSVWDLLLGNQLIDAVQNLRKESHFQLAASLLGTNEEHVFCDDEGSFDVTGNPDRIVYRYTLRQKCQKATDQYERAIYGLLGGIPDPGLKLCTSWIQTLWVLCTTLLENLKDHLVFEQLTKEFRPEFDSNIQKYLPDKSRNISIVSVIDKLMQSTRTEIRHQSRNHMTALQTALMLDKHDQIISNILNWCKAEVQSQSPLFGHFLRFGVSAAVTSSLLGVCRDYEHVDCLVELYCKFLINDFEQNYQLINCDSSQDLSEFLARKFSLIAKYSSMVPEKSHQLFGLLVAKLPQEHRSDALMFAREYAIDSTDVARSASSFHQKDVNFDPFSRVEGKALQGTLKKCSESLSFLIIDPKQRGEALIAVNKMVRYLIKNDKFESARQLLQEIPGDSEQILKNSWSRTGGKSSEVNAFHEFNCHVALCHCYHLYSEWRRSQGKSTEVTSDDVVHAIYNCLQIDGGFLRDIADDFVDSERQSQINQLRSRRVPDLIFLLHSVLRKSGEFNECVKLADLIASEEYEFLPLFAKEDLVKFLNFMADDSISVLEHM
ncbi:hypothetical protein GEMRC1_011257 [Eukaryota sp. GEM-RC1]